MTHFSIDRPRTTQPDGDTFEKALDRFMRNLRRYRQKCGRTGIRGVSLKRWEHVGEELDWLEGIWEPRETEGK